jgi:hypothetical protein
VNLVKNNDPAGAEPVVRVDGLVLPKRGDDEHDLIVKVA